MQLLKAQIEYLNSARGKPGYGCFLEMGLGKTLAILQEFLDSELLALIIVCPYSLMSNWSDEITDTWKLPITPVLWQNTWGEWVPRCAKLTRPALIINYEAIRSAKTRAQIMAFVELYKQRVMLVFDESIQISSHDSQQTKAAIEINKAILGHGISRVLSGRPTRSGPHDLWSQLRAVGEIDGWNYYAWRTVFCKMGGFKAKQIVGTKNEERLAKILEPIAFFASKADYTDLPPKTYTKRGYELGDVLQKHYDSMFEEFVVWLENEDCIAIETALTKYEKLSQIQCGFIIDEKGNPIELVPASKNPRLKALTEVISDTNSKVCISYRHRYVLNILQAALAPLRPVALTGGMTPAAISDAKRAFNNDPNHRIALLQMNSAKYGHTLLGDQLSDFDFCSTMLMFENDYSLDARTQIEDRIHRHGQKRDDILYVDFFGTPLDHDVVNSLQRKEGVFQTIVKFIKDHRAARNLSAS